MNERRVSTNYIKNETRDFSYSVASIDGASPNVPCNHGKKDHLHLYATWFIIYCIMYALTEQSPWRNRLVWFPSSTLACQYEHHRAKQVHYNFMMRPQTDCLCGSSGYGATPLLSCLCQLTPSSFCQPAKPSSICLASCVWCSMLPYVDVMLAVVFTSCTAL